ncbi:hypothetical protein FALCPG4_004432 [Fusarium falciforme]
MIVPPPEGPIHLGSILRNLSEFEPLNQTVHTIPETLLCPVDTKTGFEISLSELHAANLDLRARALGLLGVGANASIERTRGTDWVLSCQHLKTITFSPTKSYVTEAMENPDVRSFMRSSRFRVPVYMVTGLKVASSASFTSSARKSVAMETDVGLVPPWNTRREKWYSANDIIVAFKVKKVRIDRHGEVQYQTYNKKAVMLSAASSSREPEETLYWDDDITLEEINDMFGMEEDGI